MKTVILGGTGFIGFRLARFLAGRGDEVVIPSRSPGKKGAGAHAFQFQVWDGRDAGQLARVIDGADSVVNLLGENIAARRWSAEQKARIVDSRLLAGKALTDAFALTERRPSVVIQASAVGWYGAWPDLTTAPACSEECPAGSNFLAETAVRWEASTAGIPLEFSETRRCVIRTAPVLGPNGGMLRSVLPVFRYGLGGATGSGRQPFAWIHLDDEVAAIAWLLDREDLAGPFNLAAPQTVSNAAFAKALGAVLHRPAWLPAPAFALRLLLGDMADELLLTGQNAVPERLEHSGFRFVYPTLDVALQQILG